jgi:hypothetical protein
VPNPAVDPLPQELVLTRLIDVPRDKLFRCGTEPVLITQWFTPPPWLTVAAELDVRPGGSSLVISAHLQRRACRSGRSAVFGLGAPSAPPSGHSRCRAMSTVKEIARRTRHPRCGHWASTARQARVEQNAEQPPPMCGVTPLPALRHALR